MDERLRSPDPRSLVAGALVSLLAAACAPAGGGPGAEGGGAPDGSSLCRGDCSVRVQNRTDRRIEVSTDRRRASPMLGVVWEHEAEVFRLPDFHGQHLELWIRDAESQELVRLTCVRRFLGPERQARVVVGTGEQGGGAC